MRLLELFKGTGSVGKTFTKIYPDSEIVSLDILKKYNPTICSDILDWDYKSYETGYFDIIWASPECKIYSTLQQSLLINKWGKTRDEQKYNLEEARRANDKYVLRVLDIIYYFRPEKWYIENPWSSNMKMIPQLAILPSYRFDYCRFGYDYQKPTRIWSNQYFNDMKCNCFFRKTKLPNKHKITIGNFGTQAHTVDERYAVPEKLVEHLVERKHIKQIGQHRTTTKKNPDQTNLSDRYSIPGDLLELLIKD